MADKDEKKKKKRDWDVEPVADAGEGVEAVADGCFGCDINLLIALTLLAGVPLLLWAG